MKLWLAGRLFACVLLGWALVAPDAAVAQLFGGKKGSVQVAPSGGSSEGSGELVSAGENPVVRFSVAHIHVGLTYSFCSGYLYFSRDTMRYEVTTEKDKHHAFEFKRADLSSAGQWHGMNARVFYAGSAEFRFPEGTYHFLNLRSGQAGTVGGSARQQLQAYGSISLPFQELVNAANNFDQVVSGLKEKEARLHPPAAPAIISMLEPAGIEAGKSLDTSLPKLRLRGIASHASGIATVSVNGETAFLKTLAPQTVEFEVAGVNVNPGASAVVVLATAADKSQGQLIFTVNRAEVKVLDPAPNSETSEGTIKVRGVARGFRSVERVELAGVSGRLHPRESGETEFEVERVPLSLGSNTLSGSVSAPNGVRQNFQIIVKRSSPPGPPPLTFAEIQKALQDGVTANRMSTLVAKFGVDFSLTDDTEKELRAAGADSSLLVVIAKSRK